jgi:hypothetical protein
MFRATGGEERAGPSQWRGIKFAGFRDTTLTITGYEAVADSTDVVVPWNAVVYDTDAFWSAGNPTRLTVPAGVSKVRLKGNIDWTFGGSGYRHTWMHKNEVCSAPPRRASTPTAVCRASAPGWSSSRRRLLRAHCPTDLCLDQERRQEEGPGSGGAPLINETGPNPA